MSLLGVHQLTGSGPCKFARCSSPMMAPRVTRASQSSQRWQVAEILRGQSRSGSLRGKNANQTTKNISLYQEEAILDVVALVVTALSLWKNKKTPKRTTFHLLQGLE